VLTAEETPLQDAQRSDSKRSKTGGMSRGISRGQSAASLARSVSKGDNWHPAIQEHNVQMLRKKIAELEDKESHLHDEVEAARARREDLGAGLAAYAESGPGRVSEPLQRGVRLGSLLEFFVDNCGEVSFEVSCFCSEDDWRKPLCTATKLTRQCHQVNHQRIVSTSPKSVADH
ncbi:unnamed protein product, partial [Effrenium voratum]